MNGAAPLRGDVEVTVLIADDEALARRRIAEVVEGISDVRIVAQCASGRTTLRTVRRLTPHLLFLDVQMPGLSGFEVLQRLAPDERPLVVFSTAWEEYAIEAFEVHAIDYLLKPYTDERLEEAVARARRALHRGEAEEMRERLQALLRRVPGSGDRTDGGGGHTGGGSAPAGGWYLDRITVPDRDRLVVLDADDIHRIDADGDYVLVRSDGEAYLLRATLSGLEHRLDPARFLRVHRSHLVHVDRVRLLEHDEHGDYRLVLEGGERLSVGRTYRERVLARLGRTL